MFNVASRCLTVFFKYTWWAYPMAAITGVFALFHAGYLPLTGSTLAERGQFGDSFGVLTSLFTGLGFGGLVVTLFLQQRQMRQQEAQILQQQRSEFIKHYEDTLHRLLSLYAATLADVSNASGTMSGRTVLRGSTDRAMEALKREKVHIVPHDVQTRYDAGKLTPEDRLALDYLYFRNFKILTVEVDRQGRLIETLEVLLRHLLKAAPEGLELDGYRGLVASQITYIEITYFYLVALTFKGKDDLRTLLLESGLLARAAHVKRLKVHDYMYSEFWGQDIRLYKQPLLLPIDERRINAAIRAQRARVGHRGGALEGYSSPRILRNFNATEDVPDPSGA